MKNLKYLALVLFLVMTVIAVASCTEPTQSETEGTTPNSDAFTLLDIEPRLSYDTESIAKISIQDHHLGSCMGAHLTIDDPYYINKVTELLRNTVIEKISEDESDSIITDTGMQTDIYFYYSDANLPVGKISCINGYIKDGNDSFYKYNGDFPDTELVTNSYREAIYSRYPEAESGWSARRFTLSDDPYNLWVYLLHPSKSCADMPATSETVKGHTFEYPENYRIIIFYHDKLYSLSEAYENGLIDENHIFEIHVNYPDKLANLQKYDK